MKLIYLGMVGLMLGTGYSVHSAQKVLAKGDPTALTSASFSSSGEAAFSSAKSTSSWPDPFLVNSLHVQAPESLGDDDDDLRRYGCSLQPISRVPLPQDDGEATQQSLPRFPPLVQQQIIRSSDSASPSHSKESSRENSRSSVQGFAPKHVSGAEDNLNAPLLEAQLGTQEVVVVGQKQTSEQQPYWLSVGKPTLLYTLLMVMAFCHGAINKHLSDGAANAHFFAAPWREWEVGAVANVLQLLVAFVGYRSFKMLESFSPQVRIWAGIPLAFVTFGVGQMAGEMIPLPESPGFRNAAVNMWAIPLVGWYIGQLIYRHWWTQPDPEIASKRL